MTELLQFMYQGEVNVKHTELQSFMKIAETLQIKGLTTSQKSNNQQLAANLQKPTNLSSDSHQAQSNVIETKINSSSPSSSMKSELSYLAGQKRHSEYVAANEPYPIYPKKQLKRNMVDMNETNTSLDSDSIDLPPDEVFMPAVSMIEHNVKRESMDDNSSPNNTYHHQHLHHHRPSLPSTSTPLPLHQGYLYDHNASTGSYSKNIDYPNDLNFPGDFGKGSGHMDIPAGESKKWFLQFQEMSTKRKSSLCIIKWNEMFLYLKTNDLSSDTKGQPSGDKGERKNMENKNLSNMWKRVNFYSNKNFCSFLCLILGIFDFFFCLFFINALFYHFLLHFY